MLDFNSKVTVIIATTAEDIRFGEIQRAVASIRIASIKPITIIAFVNGRRFSQSVIDWLKAQSDIEYHYSKVGSFPLALSSARKLVKSEYFAFLDDDDELLAGSIDHRLSIFEQQPKLDVVVGNGLRLTESGESITQPSIKECQRDPLRSLWGHNGNWLASCAGLYKRSSFDEAFFDDYAPHSEWTYTAFRIAYLRKVEFTSQLTYRIHFTEHSLSKGLNYIKGQYNCIRKIMRLNLPKDIRTLLKVKAINFAHNVANQALIEQKYFDAIRFHMISLCSAVGFRKYIAFSRYFLRPSRLN